MLSQSFVFQRSKNFTSNNGIQKPPTVPISHCSNPQTNKIESGPYIIIPRYTFMAKACVERSDFLTVNGGLPPHTKSMAHGLGPRMTGNQAHHAMWRPAPIRWQTTGFLTATTLIYIIGAGITAAAGTRLALQSILDKIFKLFSLQLANLKGSPLLFLVTTSLCQHWVVCAPAANLGCGSRF